MKRVIDKDTFVRDDDGTGSSLREIVQEASRSLAVLDANRLEELAQSCEELSRRSQLEEGTRRRLVQEAQQGQREMALLALLLKATRANLRILYTLKAIQSNKVEYVPLMWRD